MSLLSSGCGWIYGEEGLVKDNEYTYLDSDVGKTLIIPEGMDDIQIVDEYPIPDISPEAKEFASGRDITQAAPTLILAVDVNSGVFTRDEKFAPTVWFRIKEIEVWQALVNYLQDNNIPVENKKIADGVIETDWIVIDQSSIFADWFGSDDISAKRYKYRFTLSKSKRRNLQLLSVQNIAAQSTRYDSNWRDEQTSRVQAIQFMNGFLGTWSQQRDMEARRRVLAANKGIELELGHDNNDNPAMMAKADFLQSWERLARVLESLGFEIEDKDQTLGIYFVSYRGPESSSFMESLKFWKSSKHNELPLKEGDYQLNLSALTEQTAITMFTKEGTVLSVETLNKIYPDFAEQFGNRVKTKYR